MKDTLNIAVGNCFRKRIKRAAKLLEKLRDEGDE